MTLSSKTIVGIIFKNLFIWIIGILVIGGFAIVFYTSTNDFTNRVAEFITSSTNLPTEFKKKVRIKGIYPSLILSAPSTHITFKEAGDASRVRIKNLLISLDSRPLVSGEIVNLKINMEEVFSISESGSAETLELGESLGQIPNLFDLHREAIQYDVDAAIDSFTLMSRGNGATTSQSIKSLNLNIRDSGLDITGSLLINNVLREFIIKTGNGSLLDNRNENDFLLVTANLLADESHPLTAITFRASRIKNKVDITGFNLMQNKNEIRSRLSLQLFEPAERRPQISGEILIRRFDFSTWVPPFGQNSVISASGSDPKLFDQKVIPYNNLTQIELDLILDAGAVRYKLQPLLNGKFRIRTDDDQLQVTAQGATSMGAPLSLLFEGKKLQGFPYFSLHASIRRLDLTRVGSMVGEEGLFNEGIGRMDIKLAYHGVTTVNHAESLDGHIELGAEAAHLTAGFSEWLDKGIVSHVKGIASRKPSDIPSSGRDIPCINAYLEIQNGYGIADESILIETPDNLLISSGYANFRDESINFTFKSGTKKFLDWSPMGLVRFMRIGGTLGSPKVSVNSGEVTKQGAMTAVSVFAGPVPGLALSAVNAARARKSAKPECKLES